MSKKNNKVTFKQKLMNHKKLCISLGVVIILVIAIIGGIMRAKSWSTYTVHHLHTHLTTISDNNRLLGNKEVNGKYNIIFYMHNCPHCEQAVPKVYVHNKFSLRNVFTTHHIQYRDVAGNNTNLTLAEQAGVSSVPTRTVITFHNGKVIHFHKTSSLNY